MRLTATCQIILVGVILFCPTLSKGSDLTFSWRDDQPGVVGYRLYMDSGETVIKDAIQPDARTVTVPAVTDGKSHVYFLTAYNEEEESRVSDAVIVKPSKPNRVADFKGNQ